MAKEEKKLLYKSIYNIGISCIENNMEKNLLLIEKDTMFLFRIFYNIMEILI